MNLKLKILNRRTKDFCRELFETKERVSSKTACGNLNQHYNETVCLRISPHITVRIPQKFRTKTIRTACISIIPLPLLFTYYHCHAHGIAVPLKNYISTNSKLQLENMQPTKINPKREKIRRALDFIV